MTAAVYVLAGAGETVQVFPSQTHPVTLTPFRGPVWETVPIPNVETPDTGLLAALGVI